MSPSRRQLALIGLLASAVILAAPAALPLRAESEADRLTRTIRQLAERATDGEHQSQAPDRPEAPREPQPPDRPAPARAGDARGLTSDHQPGSDSGSSAAESFDTSPNELRQLGAGLDADGPDGQRQLARPNDGGWILQTITALGIVIGLLLLLRWGWMRLSGTQTVATTPVVEVLSRTPVAPRNHVLLLRVGPRILIVGDSTSGMRTLASVEDEQEVADLLAAVNASKADSISHNFQQLLSRFGAAHDQAAPPDQPYAADAAGWSTADDGRDHAEHLFDRTRNNVSGLASRIRSLSRRGGRP